MAVAHTKKGLGRGLSALIPDADMDFLSRVARGDAVPAPIKPIKAVPRAEVNTSRPPKRKALEKRTDMAFVGAQALQSMDATDKSVDEKIRPEVAVKSDALSITEPIIKAIVSNSDGESNPAQLSEGQSLIEWVDISKIAANPYQPRRTFSVQEMEDLAASIREHGVLQPILLRPLSDESGKSFQLVAGERRWRAAQLADIAVIPAIVRPLVDQQALELALIENVQRHDITALDAALAYRRLAQEFSLSQEAVAQRVGKSRVAVTNTMRLLDLPTEAQKAIEDGVISEGHGRAILLASGDGARRAVLRRTVRERLSVRATEELARQIIEDDATTSTKSRIDAPTKAKNVKDSLALKTIEEALQKKLQTRVRLKPRSKGGQIVVEYFSTEDLQRLIASIIG